ncbi:PTS cellobiose transporter subunit IIC [Caproiciproducens sp. MSJ-32]|uniref:PTS cellobiose transporter subunit IIC n=1 Tax=Caproiciproducens sp. MSJ-32 TaxID=2841527 RepID=UPI001C118AA0|nr:PTS cellobiose transporter subunit IIC [Caproiciproducens sp. MSJ-32]MBU5455852.1 PTS cellobiose transporter subunit IIC [Caproiciproducens sp. MSJ-32]
MEAFIKFLENKMMPIAGKIAAERHIRALRDGLSITMPLIIVGSIFMILGNLPIDGYADFVNGIIPDFTTKILYPVRVTFDIVSLLAVFSISYYLAKDKEVDGLSAGAIALSAFLLLIPVLNINETLQSGEILNLGRVWQTTNFSAGGLVAAILTAIISTEIFIYIVNKNWVIKMPDSVPPAVSKSFSAITPALVILVVFLGIRLFFEATSYETVFAFISKFLEAPIAAVGLSFGGTLSTIFLYHFFWTMGIHGTRVVFGVMDSILLPAMDQNRLALEAGAELPNIVTKQFHDIFVNGIGGCGATLGLIVVMIIFAKSKQLKTISKLAIGPAIFNISEPIIFGIPVVLNPIMIIPFVIGPMLAGAITYLSMYFGLVSAPAGIAVPWTTPLFISGILATNGDIMAGVIQFINVIVVGLVYLPFVKVYDRQLVEQEKSLELEEAESDAIA